MQRALTLAEALRWGHGIERSFLCPEHGDSRPSASVNIIKRKWHCFTCHAHGDLNGEARLVEPDYQKMKLWLDNKLAEGTVYPESWLSRYDAGPVHPYWLARVGEVAARRFRLGYDAEADAVTYPLRDEAGQVLGVVRRSLGGEGPKYKYPAGIDVGRLLFNYTQDHREAVVLAEGALDAIALWNVGVDALAIYGSRLSVAQVRLIDKIDPEFIYTAYDMDDAGWLAYRETEQAFRHRLVTRLTWPRAWGGDIDEIGETRRRKVVDDLVSSGVACIE
jgi:Toprim-like/CHC2 zinc finger